MNFHPLTGKSYKFWIESRPELRDAIIARLTELTDCTLFGLSYLEIAMAVYYRNEGNGIQRMSIGTSVQHYEEDEHYTEATLSDLYDLPPVVTQVVALAGRVVEVPQSVYESLLRELEVYFD